MKTDPNWSPDVPPTRKYSFKLRTILGLVSRFGRDRNLHAAGRSGRYVGVICELTSREPLFSGRGLNEQGTKHSCARRETEGDRDVVARCFHRNRSALDPRGALAS